MTEFLVELYISREDRASLEREVEQARITAAEMTSEGTPIRYVRSIFVPEDETCFFLYEAASAASVRTAARRARLPFERVAEAANLADPMPLAEPKGEEL
jgi:hypothetical protein